jgi:hypothetical protein
MLETSKMAIASSGAPCPKTSPAFRRQTIDSAGPELANLSAQKQQFLGTGATGVRQEK